MSQNGIWEQHQRPGRQRLIESDIVVDVSTWTLGLESWIIQDGNYGDFSTGQEVELAAEYWSEAACAHPTDQ